MTCLSAVRVLATGTVVLIAWSTASHAGPCTARIDQMQAQVDAKVDAIAGKGRSAPESAGARLHREPTPGSIARAEQSLGEGASVETAVSALDRAREADRVGNVAGCERALAEAHSVISQ